MLVVRYAAVEWWKKAELLPFARVWSVAVRRDTYVRGYVVPFAASANIESTFADG